MWWGGLAERSRAFKNCGTNMSLENQKGIKRERNQINIWNHNDHRNTWNKWMSNMKPQQQETQNSKQNKNASSQKPWICHIQAIENQIQIKYLQISLEERTLYLWRSKDMNYNQPLKNDTNKKSAVKSFRKKNINLEFCTLQDNPPEVKKKYFQWQIKIEGIFCCISVLQEVLKQVLQKKENDSVQKLTYTEIKQNIKGISKRKIEAYFS